MHHLQISCSFWPNNNHSQTGHYNLYTSYVVQLAVCVYSDNTRMMSKWRSYHVLISSMCYQSTCIDKWHLPVFVLYILLLSLTHAIICGGATTCICCRPMLLSMWLCFSHKKQEVPFYWLVTCQANSGKFKALWSSLFVYQ